MNYLTNIKEIVELKLFIRQNYNDENIILENYWTSVWYCNLIYYCILSIYTRHADLSINISKNIIIGSISVIELEFA